MPTKGDGKRYIVRSDELVMAFLELEAMLLMSKELPDGSR
jgi:hypothetical protein